MHYLDHFNVHDPFFQNHSCARCCVVNASLLDKLFPPRQKVSVGSVENIFTKVRKKPFLFYFCSTKDDTDRHPERRMKAAFAAFEEANMPRLKQENPNMRLSQLKQLLKKEWTKSPENPLNQRFTAYNK